MDDDQHLHLSRRERQIMDSLYARGRASVSQVQQDLPEAPTTMAVRRLMQILEEKGHLRRVGKQGREVLYAPVRPRRRAGQADLRRVIDTFFGGSPSQALLAHLSDPGAQVSDEELKRLAAAIRKARKGGS